MSETETLAAALVAALPKLTNIAKGHEGGGGGKTYTYANIADLIAETRPILAQHGIVALTPITDHADGLACTVTLIHEGGGRLDFGPFPFPAGRDAQSTGSWVTYIRRYALLSALGMGAEDDDGAGAKAQERPTQRRQERPRSNATSSDGLGERAAYNRLIEHLVDEGKDEPDAVALAAAVWSEVKPKIADGHLAPGEWERVVKEADGRLEAR